MKGNKAFNQKYSKYYDLFNKNKDYKKEVDFLEEVFEKYADQVVKNILDLGCGTGIHAQHLSNRGYKIHGLDLSEGMLEIARSKNIPNTKFYQGDMSNFNLNKKYDACICMFAAFGYLTKNHQIKSSLESIKKHLNPKGLFILDCWNGLGVMNELPTSRTKSSVINDYKIKRVSHPELDPLNHICKVRFEVEVSKKDKKIDFYEENHKMRFFFPQELKTYLENGGFNLLEVCDTFKLGSKVDENNWNMVFISRLK